MQPMTDESVTDESVANSIRLEIPAELQYLERLGDALREFLGTVPDLAEPEVTLYNVELAVQEIAANIVTHAYSESAGKITLSATLADNPICINITLQDRGRSFNPESVAKPRLGEIQEHGFGLFLANALMDTVEYQNSNGENIWHLCKTLELATE